MQHPNLIATYFDVRTCYGEIIEVTLDKGAAVMIAATHPHPDQPLTVSHYVTIFNGLAEREAHDREFNL